MKTKSKKLSPLRQAVQDTYEDYFLALHSYHQSDEYKKFEEKLKKMEKKHKRIQADAYSEKYVEDDLGGNYVIALDPLIYINVSKADAIQKKALTEWLRNQTLPVIPGVEMACYVHDYERFHYAFVRGNIATVTD